MVPLRREDDAVGNAVGRAGEADLRLVQPGQRQGHEGPLKHRLALPQGTEIAFAPSGTVREPGSAGKSTDLTCRMVSGSRHSTVLRKGSAG